MQRLRLQPSEERARGPVCGLSLSACIMRSARGTQRSGWGPQSSAAVAERLAARLEAQAPPRPGPLARLAGAPEAASRGYPATPPYYEPEDPRPMDAELARGPGPVVLPPYALTDEKAQSSWRPESQPARVRPAVGGHGDILGWSQHAQGEEERAQRRRGAVPRQSAESGFLQWPQQVQQEAAAERPACRPGRRLYGRAASASESAPFGRSCDVSGGGSGPRSGSTAAAAAAAPFGTDRDLQLRRPEDAGTDEYRASLGLWRR
ncbi:Gnl2 [Symbiodinium microadriaticum]|nr:Gnl2 [Symbiodinium microadriaticum]